MADPEVPSLAAVPPADGDPGVEPPSESADNEEDAAFSRTVGQRLRAVRRAQGLSLADVEARSGGRWSASAVGAYERGFRNLSVPRLKALADFFSVPTGVLLGEPASIGSGTGGGLVLDLEALRSSLPGSPLARFTEAIAQARGDFNGRILSIRRDDLQAVCAMVHPDPGLALQSLREAGILLSTGVDSPAASAEA